MHGENTKLDPGTVHIMAMNLSVTGVSKTGIHLNSDIQRGATPMATKRTLRNPVIKLVRKIRTGFEGIRRVIKFG